MGEFLVGAYIVFSTLYFIWLGRTVRTQATTIDALQTLLDSMRTVLESTDEKNMLQRLKAYKEFVDLEQEAHIKQVHQEKEETLEEFKKGAASRIELVLKRYEEQTSGLFNVLFRLMPYVPPDERTAQIESVDFGDQKKLKESIRSTADSAPYISAEEIERSREFVQTISRMFQQAEIPPRPPTSPKKD